MNNVERRGDVPQSEETNSDDVEQSTEWLHGLRRLNAAIAATGEPLGGNLCYHDLQSDYETKPPIAETRVKRDLLRSVVAGRNECLRLA